MTKFVWLDMEMSGIYPKDSVILEIAYIITDTELNVIEEFKPITISHNLDNMNWSFVPGTEELCLTSFEKSGLLGRIKKSNTTIEQAEQKLLNDMQKHCEKKNCHFAGNSVWRDTSFLEKYMPEAFDYCYHRILDVSAFKMIRIHWYPEVPPFPKAETHDALTDIKESIEELKYYRKALLK